VLDKPVDEEKCARTVVITYLRYTTPVTNRDYIRVLLKLVVVITQKRHWTK